MLDLRRRSAAWDVVDCQNRCDGQSWVDVLAERLRAHKRDLQVLFISGFHDADMVQSFVTAKGFTLLPKPFTVEALLRVVQQSLAAVKP